jgi:tRNA(fMet)-specific endonuclease VapC
MRSLMAQRLPKTLWPLADSRGELERAGQRIGIHDMMIAGHARSEGLTVVTNNVREFRRMPGLRLENWLAS